MAKIKSIQAQEILASGANPTIEVLVGLQDGNMATASCPVGYKIGEYESVSILEKDENGFILNAKQAVDNVNNIISPKLIGMEVSKQQVADRALIEMDGTQNKIKLGANATLAVSMAIAKASAKSVKLPLFLYLREFLSKTSQIRIPSIIFPISTGSIKINSSINFEEVFIIPTSNSTLEASILMFRKINQELFKYLRSNNEKILVSPNGSFAPNASTNQELLTNIISIISNSGYQLGLHLFLGLDVTANNFYNDKRYKILDKNSNMDTKSLIEFYEKLVTDNHILYLEDPIYDQDLDSWHTLTNSISKSTLVVSDNMTSTNLYRLQMAMDKKAITTMSIKPIQIGTVTEALAVAEVAKTAGIKIVTSSRTFETNDNFIADFAVAVGSDYIKFGAPTRGEHLVKFNRLAKIQEQMKLL